MRRPKEIVRVVVVLSVLSTLAIFVVSILLPWCCERGGQDGALTETEMQNIERIDKQIKCAKEARKRRTRRCIYRHHFVRSILIMPIL